MFTRVRKCFRKFVCLTVCQVFILSHATNVVMGYQMSEDQNISEYVEQLRDLKLDYAIRKRAAEELGKMRSKSKEVIIPLADTLKKDPVPIVRSSAAISLGNMTNEAKLVIPYLRSALLNREEETDPEVRISAAVALGGMFSEAHTVIQILSEAMKEDPDARVRIDAIFYIGRFGAASKSEIPSLINAFKASSDNERLVTGKREQYIEDHPPLDNNNQPLDSNHQRAYNAQIREKFDSSIQKLKEERVQIADSLVLISNGSVEQKDTEAISPVKDAYAEISKNDETASQASLINENISHLKDIGHTPFLTTFYNNALFIILPLSILLIIWLTLLLIHPLWLFRINEFLALVPEVRIEKLGGITLSVRYLFLVGFFHYNRRVLDALVSKYLEKAQGYFNQKQTVADRAVHVPLGLFLNKKTYVDEFKVENFRDIYSQPHSRLLIFGEGGAGKTSLACQFANWAMEREKHGRLCQTHSMLPLLIEQDFENSLLKVISDQLTDMIDAIEAPPQQLLKQLLKKRRILVIIDGMSEMNETTRSSILSGITELSVNAVIITSRFDEPLKGLSKNVIEPIRLQNVHVDAFIKMYLNKLNKDELFGPDEIQNHCERLHAMIGEGRDLTVLLAKYYVVNMIAAKEGDTSEDLPENIPYLMVNYIRLINRKPGPKAPDTSTLILVAEIIAWECLKTKYRPMPAKFDDVLEALSKKQKELFALKYIRDERKKTEIIHHITEYLEKNLKLIQTHGARQDQIRFALDTLSEYLAGLFLIREYGSDEKEWNDFLISTDERVVDRNIFQRALKDKIVEPKEDLPEAILSFLLALYDCCLTEEASELIPIFVLEELKRKIIIRRIIKDIKSPNAEERLKALKEFERTESIPFGLTQKFIVPALIEMLTDSELKIRDTSKEALIKLGEIAIPELTSASQREESELGITALRLLATIRGKIR